VIEDLHWIDPTSDELIGVLLQSLSYVRRLLIPGARTCVLHLDRRSPSARGMARLIRSHAFRRSWAWPAWRMMGLVH